MFSSSAYVNEDIISQYNGDELQEKINDYGDYLFSEDELNDQEKKEFYLNEKQKEENYFSILGKGGFGKVYSFNQEPYE